MSIYYVVLLVRDLVRVCTEKGAYQVFIDKALANGSLRVVVPSVMEFVNPFKGGRSGMRRFVDGSGKLCNGLGVG